MEIVLCGQCGFIGIDSELAYLDSKRINDNVFSCRCCIKCRSTSIYYRSSGVVVNKEVAMLPPTHATFDKAPALEPVLTVGSSCPEQEQESLDDSAIQEVFDVVSTPSIVKEKEKKKAEPNRTQDTKKRFKKTCDICQQPFESKVGGADFGSRCKKCLDNTIKKFT